MRVEIYANDGGEIEIKVNGRLVSLKSTKVDYLDEVGEVFAEIETDDFADGGAWVYHNLTPKRKKRAQKIAR